VAELASQVCSIEVSIQSIISTQLNFTLQIIEINVMQELDVSTTRGILATPSRFTSSSQNRSWNTGNGSPDAICFTVDRPNVSVIGVGVFGGGGSYTYELELLELASFSIEFHSKMGILRGCISVIDSKC
jgi:hypothetical protein